jgi:hypothetical protein
VSHSDIYYDSICRDEFAEINEKLDRLDKAIRGNGNPGIMMRLDRLEQCASRQRKLAWLIVGSALTIVASVLVAWITGGIV